MAVSNLSPFQQAIQNVAGRGKGATASAAQLAQIADSTFGPAPVPPGSQIISQDATTVRWIDPEGFEHTATRSLNGTDPNAGQWRDQTNRPAVLPQGGAVSQLPQQLAQGIGGLSQQQLANAQALARGENVAALDPGIQQYLDQIAGISSRLSGPTTLAQLDPATIAALEAQSQAEVARNQQQFQDQSGDLLARLFSQGVQRSSIATGAAGELAQRQGLVTQQQSADAALRALQLQLGLTEEERNRLNSALAGLSGAAQTGLESFRATTGASQDQTNAINTLLQNLTQQQTSRDIAGAGIDLSKLQLGEQARQTNLGFELNQQEADLRRAEQNSLLNKFLKGSQIVANITGGVGAGLGAYKALTGGK